MPKEKEQEAPVEEVIAQPENEIKQPDPEEIETDEPDEGEAGNEAEGEEEAKKPRSQKRIEELSAKEREAKETADYWKRVAEERAQEERRPAPAEQPKGDEPKKPDPKDFPDGSFDDGFIDAMAEYKAALKMRDYEAQQRAKAEEERRHRAEQDRRAKLLDIKAKYDERLASESDEDTRKAAEAIANRAWTPHLTPIMPQVIVDHDQGVKLAAYLETKPLERERISKLSAVQQVMELTRIADKFSTQKPKPSRAEPLPTGSGGSARTPGGSAKARGWK